jgi:outer membrane protein with beta-barrel domain
MRPRILTCLSVLALVVIMLPSAASAQERKGFWIGVGGGFGSADVSCDDCDDDREGSGSGYLKLGWTLSPQLLVGAEFNLWAKTFAIEEGVTATANLYNISGTLTYYPRASSGFFVKGGAGASTADVDFDLQGTNATVEIGTGLGLLAGAGYDWSVSPRISITPAVNFWYGQLGDVTLRGQPFQDNWSHNVVDFTVGITFH